jgi:hypothetical protein
MRPVEAMASRMRARDSGVTDVSLFVDCPGIAEDEKTHAAKTGTVKTAAVVRIILF